MWKCEFLPAHQSKRWNILKDSDVQVQCQVWQVQLLLQLVLTCIMRCSTCQCISYWTKFTLVGADRCQVLPAWPQS